tara:strand:- start:315 stop:431 length:117 start_codon:yes stop_codon:yes gene_type:complete
MATEWATDAYNKAKANGDLDGDSKETIDTYASTFVNHV